MKYHICTQKHTALQVVISSLHYIDIIYTACKPGHTFLCASVWYHSLYACLPTRIKFSQNMSPQIKYSPFFSVVFSTCQSADLSCSTIYWSLHFTKIYFTYEVWKECGPFHSYEQSRFLFLLLRNKCFNNASSFFYLDKQKSTTRFVSNIKIHIPSNGTLKTIRLQISLLRYIHHLLRVD